jgi:hypothetical protein
MQNGRSKDVREENRNVVPERSITGINLPDIGVSKDFEDEIGGRERYSQIQLYTIANSIVCQGKLILERSFTLAFQQDLVRFTANPSSDHSLE